MSLTDLAPRAVDPDPHGNAFIPGGKNKKIQKMEIYIFYKFVLAGSRSTFS